MLVIKNTPYIFDLYKNCFNIIEFDKLYKSEIKAMVADGIDEETGLPYAYEMNEINV